jgi:hypothetical protein
MPGRNPPPEMIWEGAEWKCDWHWGCCGFRDFARTMG